MTTNGYDKIFGVGEEQVEKASATAFKTYEEFSKLGKDNLDAYVAAGTIFAQGIENIGKGWMSFGKQSVEASVATAKAMLGVKTLREAMDLHADWAKSTFDKFVAESTKASETSVKVANEALEPINARVNVAVEKFLKPLAA